MSTPQRASVGTTRFNNSSRFAYNSPGKKVVPVILPPGWAKLAASPMATMSGPVAMTIGMVDVAR